MLELVLESVQVLQSVLVLVLAPVLDLLLESVLE